MKLYSGYYVISPDEVKFEVGEIEVEKDELYNDTYSMDGYYFVSPNYSTKYMTERYLDKILNLNKGFVMYSFNRDKVVQWLEDIKFNKIMEVSLLYSRLSNSQVTEVNYK